MEPRSRTTAHIAVAVSLALAAGCKPATMAHQPPPTMGRPNPGGTGAMASQDLDPHGGKLALESMALTVPPGVLPAAQTIAVQSSKTPAPAKLAAVTPVYQFSPDGATFALPLTVSFDYDGKTPNPVIYWSKRGSTTEYEALPTVVQGGKLYAAVTHFSQGLVASAGSGDVAQSSSTPVDVDGTQATVWVSSSGVSAPVGTDFAQSPITASYWDGAAFQPLTVAYGATGSGKFAVKSVPPGVYYLQYTAIGDSVPAIIVADTTQNRTIDLSQYRIGRANATLLSATAVKTIDPVVSAEVQAPSWPAWTAGGANNIGDTFEIYSPDTGAYVYGSNDGPNDPPAGTNDTFLFHWAESGAPLVDLMLPGDAPIFFRMTQWAQNPLVQTVTHVSRPITTPAQIPALDLNNQPVALTHVPITVDSVPATQSYDVSFAASQCPAPSVVSPKPIVGDPRAFVGVDTQPGGLHRGQLAGTPDLVIAQAPAGATLSDLSAASVPVGNPFPSSWELLAIGGCSWTFQYDTVQIWSANERSNASVTGTSVSLAPAIGPPQGVQIDGQDWRGDLTLASLTPQLTWNAPATGTALGYNLRIMKLGTKNAPKVAGIRTGARSIVIPSGLLTSGARYVFQLDAFSSNGSDSNQFINALQLPSGNAPVLSGILTAP